MTFRASVLTLYPEMFPGALGLSLAGKALEVGTWSLDVTQIRDFATDRHRTVDDTPAGGGAGMVMRADILARAIDAVSPAGDSRPRLLMSPRGKPLDQARVRELAAGPGAVIVCGRFEGIDQRVINARGLQEVSVGDYILSGGEPAALVLLDAVVRLLPGVMGNEASGTHESFEDGLLEYPHYTRPQEFEGLTIPEVLTSGNHAKVAAWRRREAEKLTEERRPDILNPSASDIGHMRCKVTLSVRGDALEPEAITAALGCSSDRSWRRGEMIRISDRAKPVKAKTGYWSVTSDERHDLDGALRSLFERISPETDWPQLTGSFEVYIDCGLWLGGYNQQFELGDEAIAMLAERRIGIGFDAYHDQYLALMRNNHPVTK